MKFDKPEKIDEAFFKGMGTECMAILGCLALTAVLALAFRVFLGKW